MICDPLFYDIYMKLVNILEISRFDLCLRYDFWIFIIVMNMVVPNAFPGPYDALAVSTLSIIIID